jgi:PAS domain S-box-containing protein
VSVFAAAFACVALLSRLLHAAPPVSLFLCTIVLIAWFVGLGPALLTSALSTLAFGYFYLLPDNSLIVVARDLPRIVLFGVASLIIAGISAAQRGTAASLRRARDQLQDAVDDLQTLNEQLVRENAERKAAEEKIRAAELELQATIDMVPALIARYGHDGSFDFVNRTLQDYTGLSQESVRGRSREVLIHPEDLPRAENAWRVQVATGNPYDGEQRIRRSDGQYRWHSIRRAPLRDEKGNIIKWYGVAFDIHEQKEAEMALRRNEVYLDEAQHLSQTGSFARNVVTGESVWSKETYRILGIDRAVKPTIDLIMQHVPPDEREFVRIELDRGTQGAQDIEFEHGWLTPDGTLKQLHIRAHRVRYESGEEVVIGALMDVTEARKAQAALAAAQAQLAHANRVATLGELAASIAHEVNQPLAAIVTHGDSSLSRLGRTPADIIGVRRGVEQMIGAAERASSVVNRIRSLSKKIQPEMALVDVNEVIQEVVKVVNREIVSHHVFLRLELAPGPIPVFGDRVQLQQVIINLVVNGIQAMASVENRTRNLVVRSNRCEPDQVVVEVQDSGHGFDPEQANRLFDAFYTTKPSGMGIGLSICRTIIEAHGGRIWASNRAGAGAVFQFTVPVANENAQRVRSPMRLGMLN